MLRTATVESPTAKRGAIRITKGQYALIQRYQEEIRGVTGEEPMET